MKPAAILLISIVLFAAAAAAQDKPQAKADSTILMLDLKKLDPILSQAQKQLDENQKELQRIQTDPVAYVQEVTQRLRENIIFLQTQLQFGNGIKTDTTLRAKMK